MLPGRFAGTGLSQRRARQLTPDRNLGKSSSRNALAPRVQPLGTLNFGAGPALGSSAQHPKSQVWALGVVPCSLTLTQAPVQNPSIGLQPTLAKQLP